MADGFEVKSAGKRVQGKKRDEQDARLGKIEDKKAADKAAAAEVDATRKAAAAEEAARVEAERQAAEAAEAEARQKADAQREAVQKIGSAALSVGGAVVGSAAESAKKGELKISPKVAFFGVAAVVIIALLLFLAWPRLSALLFPALENATHTTAELSESAVMGNTVADINNAILGEARQKQELVVWEQDVQVDSEISQALANLPIFKKTKLVRSFGTGVFTVNMGKVTEDSITVDEGSHAVTIWIPHAELRYITKDLEKTEFRDTKHALLGFGDVKLTQEQQNVLEQSIEAAMRAELETEGCLADADDAALLVVYDVYQPLIVKVDAAYTLDVQFAD